ncbi:MAG: hypothetical protein Ct9H90mP19_1230 [Gammaproteobacteria bacterium]|nr:MAG: hypothetical protein Ct9H90mP19_1230 [Gammaproteobacteria bacterium]
MILEQANKLRKRDYQCKNDIIHVMLIVYNFIYFLLLPLLIVRDLFVLEKNKLKTICQKMGFCLSRSTESTIWLHGVSLGKDKNNSTIGKKACSQRA